MPKDPSADDPFFLAGIKPNHIHPPITESSRIATSEGSKKIYKIYMYLIQMKITTSNEN